VANRLHESSKPLKGQNQLEKIKLAPVTGGGGNPQRMGKLTPAKLVNHQKPFR